MTLAGNIKFGKFRLTPNANQVAVELAAASASHGLKTIVFVNTKQDAVTVARDISASLAVQVDVTPVEQERWDALKRPFRKGLSG